MFIYEFRKPFKVAEKGESTEAVTISVPAPSNFVLKHVTVIDREFNKALMAMSKNNPQTKEEPEEGESVEAKEIIILLNAYGADMEACYNALKWIIKLSGRINELVSVTDHLYNKIDYNDMKLILGGYIENFLFSSQVN